MVRTKDSTQAEFPELHPIGAALLLAGNTGDLIQWDLLPGRLQSSGPAISDVERVRLLVSLANGKTLSGRQWNQLVGLSIMQNVSEKGVPITPEHRASIRAALSLCLSESAGEKTLGIAEENLSGRLLLHPEGNTQRVIARGTHDALVYAITRAARAGNVRQCALEECGDFFFLRTSRGAPPKYCSTECSSNADTQSAAERMRSLRRKRR